MGSPSCSDQAVPLSLLLQRVLRRCRHDYAAFMKTVEKTGDFKDGVVTVSIPRNDLRVDDRRSGCAHPAGFWRMAGADARRWGIRTSCWAIWC